VNAMIMPSSNPIATLQNVFKKGSRGLKLLAIVGLLAATIGFLLSYISLNYVLEKVGGALLILSGIIWYFLDTSLRLKSQEEIERRIEQSEKAVSDHPDKARPLWDLARTRLELYFERNLSQIKSIYWVTVIIMFSGFAMITYGLFKAFNDASINASLLAAGSGVLTEFIGATFLIIYRSIMNQAASYVNTLERINAVGMSIQIIESIPGDDQSLTNKTRAELGIKILDSFVSEDKTKK